MSVYRRTLRYFKPHTAPTLGALALSLVAIGLSLLKPWPFKWIIDGVLPAPGDKKAELAGWLVPFLSNLEAPGKIAVICALLVAIHLAWGLVNLASSYLFVKVGLQALLNLRTELYSTLHGLPLKYHDARRSSDSTFRVAYDSQAVQTIYNKGFANIVTSVIMLVAAFVIMWSMDWALALISMAIIPAIVVAIHVFAKRIRDESTVIQEQESSLMAVTQEGLSSIRIVQAFGRQDHEVRQFHTQAGRSLEANLRLMTTNVTSALVIGTLMGLGTAAMLYLGSVHVLEGKLALGSLWLFTSYLAMLYAPIESLTYTAWALEGAAAGAQRCFEILDREDDIPDAPDAIEIEGTQGAVEFENVDFGYQDGRLILHDVSFSIPPGKCTAFVGGTGAGKSTLLSLVPRFYDPVAGEVRIDGIPLRKIRKKSLRHQISIVLQDTLLFSTTIRENIAYGRPDATEEQIIEAAKRARAHDFISEMPDGYASQVGERGGHLSVGQRQRIGIARAFLKNAPLLILDEPTSALDPTTEAAIMATLEELMRGRTTLIITHRIATVHHMDQIVVLDHGRVVEQGTGNDLVAAGGTYAQLYKSAGMDRNHEHDKH